MEKQSSRNRSSKSFPSKHRSLDATPELRRLLRMLSLNPIFRVFQPAGSRRLLLILVSNNSLLLSVSRIAKDLDEQVHAFLQRPIEQEIPYLFVDASYYKVREGPRYITKALLVIAGVRMDGYREILGARITDCENEMFWSGLFEDLKERGLTGVKLVVSDGHAGIQKAAEAAFLGASWQMCSVHCTRAVLKNIPRKHQKEVAESLKEAYGDEERLQQVADDLNERGYRKAANTIERFLPGLMSYTAFPKEHAKRIRTTNMMERVNKELKRRTKVVGAFPNEESLLRLAGSILMDINEEWVTGRKYLTMEGE